MAAFSASNQVSSNALATTAFFGPFRISIVTPQQTARFARTYARARRQII
jgi:hypothetical protein